MLRKLIKTLLISITLSLNSYANCTTKLGLCDTALSLCDKALEKRKEEVKLCNLGLIQQRDVIANLQIDNRRKDEQLSAWYRNPFVVGILGIAVGGLAVTIINH